jgi:hypothetical protein
MYLRCLVSPRMIKTIAAKTRTANVMRQRFSAELVVVMPVVVTAAAAFIVIVDL